MACPTCGHTLGSFVAPAPFRYYHCERCGTVVVRDATGKLDDTVYVPKLVERCREFEEWLPIVTAGDDRCWESLGLAESIRRPEDRPKSRL